MQEWTYKNRGGNRLIHMFSELDLDPKITFIEAWDKVFDFCENLGFMPYKIDDNTIGITGPFNVNDDIDMMFCMHWNKERTEIDEIFVKAKANTWTEEHTFWLFKDGQEQPKPEWMEWI